MPNSTGIAWSCVTQTNMSLNLLETKQHSLKLPETHRNGSEVVWNKPTRLWTCRNQTDAGLKVPEANQNGFVLRKPIQNCSRFWETKRDKSEVALNKPNRVWRCLMQTESRPKVAGNKQTETWSPRNKHIWVETKTIRHVSGDAWNKYKRVCSCLKQAEPGRKTREKTDTILKLHDTSENGCQVAWKNRHWTRALWNKHKRVWSCLKSTRTGLKVPETNLHASEIDWNKLKRVCSWVQQSETGLKLPDTNWHGSEVLGTNLNVSEVVREKPKRVWSCLNEICTSLSVHRTNQH